MSVPSRPMRTAREAFKPAAAREALLYSATIHFFRLTGLWRYPVRAAGDFEEMRFLDKAYWLHKAERPVTVPCRGSGLREHFERQDPRSCTPPEGFVPSHTLRLSAAGDLMNHAYLARSGETLYEDVADLIFDVDVAMANLECVVREAAAGPLDINTKEAPGLYLLPGELDVAAGGSARRYDLLATACNHSLDFGLDGVESTIGALRRRGIAWSGVNETEDDAGKATIIERRGIRLGVISSSFGLNGKRPPPDRPNIVNRTKLNAPLEAVDFSMFERQLVHCRDANVDFVVAQLHWGMEHEMFPRPSQIEVAHRLAEMGVDAIFGHHPHVIQPTEYYRTRRDPGRVVPICYSLGNLTTPFSAPFTCRSLIARLDLAKGRTEGGATRTYVDGVQLTEVMQTPDDVQRTLRLRRAT